MQNYNYYDMQYMPYRSPYRMMQQDNQQNPYMYPQNVPDALRAIEDAVAGELKDRMFYQYLIENAPDDETVEIIKGIQNDEINHFTLFRNVYYSLTGEMLPPPKDVEFEEPTSYCEGIGSALKGEQNAVRKYREILYALQDRTLINILVGIITDEIRHGILYNYLFTKNGCRY